MSQLSQPTSRVVLAGAGRAQRRPARLSAFAGVCAVVAGTVIAVPSVAAAGDRTPAPGGDRTTSRPAVVQQADVQEPGRQQPTVQQPAVHRPTVNQPAVHQPASQRPAVQQAAPHPDGDDRPLLTP